MFKDKRANWLIGGFLVSLLIIVLALDSLINKKPIVYITFDDATHIVTDKTVLRYKGFIVGKVTSIAPDYETNQFIVTVTLDSYNNSLRSSKATYWLLDSIENSETTKRYGIAEPYIAVLPAKRPFQEQFIAVRH